jgi:hypothetical protein
MHGQWYPATQSDTLEVVGSLDHVHVAPEKKGSKGQEVEKLRDGHFIIELSRLPGHCLNDTQFSRQENEMREATHIIYFKFPGDDAG